MFILIKKKNRKDMEEFYYIGICCDKNNIINIKNLIKSIIKNWNINKKLKICILTDKIINDAINYYNKKIKKYKNIFIEFNEINENNVKNIVFKTYYLKNSHINHYLNFARFYLPQFFPESKYMLYIDYDCIINCDLSILIDLYVSYNRPESILITSPIEISGYKKSERDIYYFDNEKKENINSIINFNNNQILNNGISDINIYCSTGLYVMNCDFCRSEEYYKKLEMIVNVRKNYENEQLTQPILNELYNNKKIYIDYKYQVLSYEYIKNGYLIYENPEEVKVIHYCGTMKPWLIENLDDSVYNLWKKYK
jgi:lipopolysaccharide biosynthesis glycosyltransferase